MDIWKIRLENMRSLAKREGSGAALARKLDMAYPLLQNYIGKHPTKRIGDVPIDKAMKAFNLPHGWFDTPHDSVPAAEPARREIWPFAVDRARFDALPLEEKERIGRFVRDTVETWEGTQARDSRKAG